MKRHSDRGSDDLHAKRSRGGIKGSGKRSSNSSAKIPTNGLGVIKRHGFKVLCADRLAAKLIGKNGDARAQLQEESGSNVWISKRDEVFPNPKFRLLILHADEPGQILDALERVVPKLVEVAEKDREAGEADQPLAGKEEGEYVFHAALPSMIRGKLIGKSGANIQDLRERTNAKIFVENNAFNGHHATRIVGTPERICHVLTLINDFVQEAADSDEFRLWIASAPDADGPVRNQDMREQCGDFKMGKCTRGDACKYSHDIGSRGEQDRRHDREPDRDPRRDGRDRDRNPPRHRGRTPPRDRRSPPGRGSNWQPQTPENDELLGLLGDPRFSSPADIPEGSPLDVMEALARQLPEAAARERQAISCQLPQDLLADIVDAETWRFIEDRTGASVELTGSGHDTAGAFTTIMFTGDVLSTYFAHFLLMQRIHEHKAAEELQERDAARKGSGDMDPAEVARLKAQVAALESRLRNASQGGGHGGRR